jgi:hypothetical protein
VATKRIQHDDLFEPKIAKGIIKELNDLIDKGEETEKTLKGILKVLQDIDGIKTAEEFKAFTAQSEKLTKAQKELVKTEQELAKVQERIIKDIEKQAEANKKLSKTEADKIKLINRLNEANSTRVEGNEVLKVQLQEQNKVNKNRAKEALNLIGAYEKESATLNKLRKKYKNLAVQNKENTEEGKDLLKNITKLDKKLKDVDDTVGQNQRSVGKYEKALSGLNNTIGKLGVIALIAKGFQILSDLFGSSREGALELQIALSKFTESAKVFVNNFIKSLTGIKDVIFGVIEAAVGALAPLLTTLIKTQLLALKAARFAKSLIGTTEKLDSAISGLEAGLRLIDSASFSDGLDRISEGAEKVSKAYEGTVETTSKAIEAQEKYLRLQLRTRIEIEQLEKSLAGLAEKRQILQDISDDDTIGFVTRAKAVKKAQQAAENFADLEIKLALIKEKLTIQAVKQDLIRSNTLSEIEIAAIQTGEQLKMILLDYDIAKKISDSNDEAFTAAFVERRDKQVEAESFRRDQEEKNRKTARDAFEQENDILTEFTELKIAANDKIISSDKSTLSERQKAFAANQKLEKDLFDNSINLIIEQGKASIDLLKETIDLRTDLTKKEKEEEKALLDKRKALITNAAIEKILNEQDIVKQGILIRNIDLGEIEEKVLKDTLKLKKELAEASKEAAEATEEAAKRTTELNQDILTQERFLKGQLEDLDAEQLDNEKQQLEERIKLLKKDSIERLELEKELNDLLIDEAKNKDEIEKEARKNKLQENKDLIDSIGAAFIEGLDKRNDAENNRLDAQVQKQESSLSIQEQRARDGLSNTLAFEQEQLDKARLAKQQELERQAKEQEIIALVQAYYNQFQELSKEDPDTAAVKAFTNTLLAKSIAKGLTGFIDGTELVERDMNGSKFSSGQDGYIAKFDGKERILNPSQNMALPKGMSNDELVQAAKDYSNGNTWGFMPTVTGSTDSKAATKAIIESNKQVIRAIESNAASMNVDSEGMMHMVESRVSRGKKELIHFINKKYKMLPK